jgi:hypothetical protein
MAAHKEIIDPGWGSDGQFGFSPAEYLAGEFLAWIAMGVMPLAFPGQMLEIKVVALAC